MRTITKRIAQSGAAAGLALTATVTMTGQAQAIAGTDYISLYVGSAMVASSYYDAVDNEGTVWDMRADGYGVFIQLQGKTNGVWSTRTTVYNNTGYGTKASYVYYGSGDIRIRLCRNQATDFCTGWKYGKA
ncbi:hypothetical protein [Embleya sp. NPDC001921]